MADWAGLSIGVGSITWQAGLDRAEHWRVVPCMLGRAEPGGIAILVATHLARPFSPGLYMRVLAHSTRLLGGNRKRQFWNT
jgi:hypothetical protein